MPILLAMVACGPPADIVSVHGVSVFFIEDGISWTEESVNEQEVWFVGRLTELPGYDRREVLDSLEKISVHVFRDPIPCGSSSPTGLCNGRQRGSLLEVRDMGCVSASAYTHEILHRLQADIRHRQDYDHSEPNVWPIADGAPRSCP